MVTIERQTLRLAIGTIRSFTVRTFFPSDLQPLKIFEDMIDGGFGRSFYVGIFDPEDERPLMTFGKEIVKNGSSSVSNMEKPGRRRSEADPNTFTHLIPSADSKTKVVAMT
jgi:hypothetical protein